LELRAAAIAFHDKNRTKRFSRLLIVVEKVRRERRASAGATSARKVVRSTPMAIEVGCLPARDFHATSRAAPVPLPGVQRKSLWMLKKSISPKTAEIWDIENVYQNGDRPS